MKNESGTVRILDVCLFFIFRQIPFDQLIANDGKTLGEKYNVIVTPCLLLLDNW